METEERTMDGSLNQDEIQQAEPNGNGRSLRELHKLYLDFVTHLVPLRESPSLAWNLQEFVAWWEGLDPQTRLFCDQDFRKGYATVLRDAQEQAATAADRIIMGCGNGLTVS
jgi:hypothetical protein